MATDQHDKRIYKTKQDHQRDEQIAATAPAAATARRRRQQWCDGSGSDTSSREGLWKGFLDTLFGAVGGLGRCKIKEIKKDDKRISSLTLFFLLPAAMAHHMLISLPATGNWLIACRSFCLQELIRISDWMTEEMEMDKESKHNKRSPPEKYFPRPQTRRTERPQTRRMTYCLQNLFFQLFHTFCKHAGRMHTGRFLSKYTIKPVVYWAFWKQQSRNLCLQKLITIFIDSVSGRDAGGGAMSGE